MYIRGMNEGRRAAGRKVIVTGGAGYIGSHTVVQLAEAGFEPIIVDDLRNSDERALKGLEAVLGRQVEVHRIDCTQEESMDAVFRAHPDARGVIHFAAYKAVGESVQEPLKYYANNIGSLLVLVRLMQRHGVDQLVFSSSCTVYGQPDHLPVNEEAPDRRANSPYGFTKVACEQLLRDASVADPRLKVVLLRYFNPIGAHPSGLIGELPLGVPNNLVPYVLQTAAGQRKALTIHGTDYSTPDGSCVRDYIHVMDLAEAHVRALEWMVQQPGGCEVFNVGTGSGRSVLEVVRDFEAVNGVPVPFTLGPRRSGDVEQVYGDTAKCERVLGWKPRRDVAEALRDAWRWQQHLQREEQPQPAQGPKA
jgi:UDP-glucose 4-epimerase